MERARASRREETTDAEASAAARLWERTGSGRDEEGTFDERMEDIEAAKAWGSLRLVGFLGIGFWFACWECDVWEESESEDGDEDAESD